METIKICVKCPMDGTDHQKYCSLVEQFKENGNTDECHYRFECSEIKTHIIEKGNLNEVI